MAAIKKRTIFQKVPPGGLVGSSSSSRDQLTDGSVERPPLMKQFASKIFKLNFPQCVGWRGGGGTIKFNFFHNRPTKGACIMRLERGMDVIVVEFRSEGRTKWWTFCQKKNENVEKLLIGGRVSCRLFGGKRATCWHGNGWKSSNCLTEQTWHPKCSMVVQL